MYKVVNAKEFYDACKWDYCACELVGQKNHTCGCQSIEMFVKECSNKGVQLKWWRDSSLCRTYYFIFFILPITLCIFFVF